MIMLKHNQHHQITYLFVHLVVITHIQQPNKSKVNDLRVKSPNHQTTDLHNSDLKITVFSFRDFAC